MTVRFSTDEDIIPAIVQGPKSREPAIDILDVKTSGLSGIADPALLELAVLPQQRAVGHIIEFLLLIWSASEPSECRNRIVYLPFR